MVVLIVESEPELGSLWAKHLERLGFQTVLAANDEDALAILRDRAVRVIVADLDLPGQGALAVADYAAYRQPSAQVVFVTASSFFSDGSIFSASANACAFLPSHSRPEDIAAVVEFHAKRAETKT